MFVDCSFSITLQIRLDGKELVVFSWSDMRKQECDTDKRRKENGIRESDILELENKWEKEGTLSEWDFLQAATDFLQMPIADALNSENCLIRIFAIMDRRVGKQKIQQIHDLGIYKTYPEWVQQFYSLRFNAEK